MKNWNWKKRGWLALALCAALALAGCADAAADSQAGQDTSQAELSATVTENAADAAAPTDTVDVEPVQLGDGDPVAAAKAYLEYWPMSKAGMVKQLQVDGYTEEQAAAAAEECGADWNEQAVLSAKSYLDTMSFTREELLDQLQYDGFTEEEAAYGVDNCGENLK